jgi:hypothetical protein
MRISYDELVSAQKMGLSQDLIDKVEGHWSQSARETELAEARREEARRNPVPMAYTPGHSKARSAMPATPRLPISTRVRRAGSTRGASHIVKNGSGNNERIDVDVARGAPRS